MANSIIALISVIFLAVLIIGWLLWLIWRTPYFNNEDKEKQKGDRIFSTILLAFYTGLLIMIGFLCG